MGRTTDQEISYCCVAFIWLAHKIVPWNKPSDEHALERSRAVEMACEGIDVFSQIRCELLCVMPLVVAGPRDFDGRQQVTWAGHGKTSAAQDSQVVCFDASEESVEYRRVKDWHACAEDRCLRLLNRWM